MSFKTAEAQVRAFFQQHWNNETPIAWPDLPFNPPENTWVRFTMQNNQGYQASTGSRGSNYFRRQGVITIQVFQKTGQGSTDARDKSDTAANIFLDQELAGFRFRNVNARDIGPDGHGWYQWNVTSEYEYDILS